MMMRKVSLVLVLAVAAATWSGAAAGVRVSGRVLAPDGSPAAKTAVRLLPLQPQMEALFHVTQANETEAAAETLTDGDGRFDLEAPHAGLWQVRAEADGLAPLVYPLRPLVEPVELPDATLAADVGLRVRVVDEAGSPVGGATVLVRRDAGRYAAMEAPRWTLPTRGGTTGEDGIVTLPQSAGRRFNATAHAPGYAAAERRGASGTAVRLVLAAGSEAKLEVVDAAGRPVPRVLAASGGRPHPLGRTDAGGLLPVRFAAGSLELSLLADDGRRQRLRVDRPEKPGGKVRMSLPEHALVAGRLIDAETRRAVEGGVIWDRSNPSAAAVSDRAGGFALSGPLGQRLRVLAAAPGYLPGSERVLQLLDDGRPGPTLALRPGAVIEGTVQDGDGRAIQGADLKLEVKHTPGMMRIEIGGGPGLPATRTGPRGKFRLSPVDPEKRYTLKVSAEGFAATEKVISDLEPYRTRGDVRVTLESGASLAGHVVGPAGDPVAGAVVKLERAKPAGAGMMRMMGSGGDAPPLESATDTAGRFSFSGLPAGRFDLSATMRGFAKGTLAGIEIAESGEPLDVGEIALQHGERLQGYVTDRTGAPVEGVQITVKEAGGPQMTLMMGPGPAPPEPDAVSDPSGWFAIDDLSPAGKYSLALARTGYVPASRAGVSLPHPDPLQITLDPASRVEGVVLDPEGEPVAGASVSLSRTRTMEMGGSVMQMMMMEDADTDVRGRFVFEDQQPGTISLAATAAGFQQAKLDAVEVPEGEDVGGIEIPLPAGAIVHGRLLMPDGRAAIGATVRKVDGEDRMARFGGEPVDGSGYYRLEGLPLGEASIEATHPDYPRLVRDVELSEGFNSLDMEFEGGHEVSGTITDTAGTPVSNAAVRLARSGEFWGGPETISRADGTYSMPGVQDGDYTLSVLAEGYARGDRLREVKVEGGPVAGVDGQISAGATVTGRITGLSPEEMAGAAVRIDRVSLFDSGERPDADGSYRIANVKPGSYQVVATADNGRQARAPVEVAEGALEVRCDVEFAPGLTLTGKAHQADVPITGASVYVSGVDVDHDAFSQTDHQGQFELQGLQAGSYKLRLQQFSSGLAYDTEFEIAASRDLDLRIPTARIAGVVHDASDRRPVAGVQVRLIPAGDGGPGHGVGGYGATTDLQGKFEVGNVPDGQWTLTANKAGFAAHSETVAVQMDRGVESVRIELDPTEGLVLQTSLPGGAAPDEVRVAVLDGSGLPLVFGNHRTGENGKVRLASVPAGRWEVLLSAAGAGVARLQAQAPGPPQAVPLPPACSLRVRVPELTEASAAAKLTIVGADGRTHRSLDWTGRPYAERPLERGAARVTSLPPGSWTVSVTTDDGRSWQGPATTTPGNDPEVVLE